MSVNKMRRNFCVACERDESSSLACLAKIFSLFIILLFLLILINLSFVNALKELPMIVSGNVYINSKIAPQGTQVIAKANNVEAANAETDEKGSFSFLLQKLETGTAVNIYADGIDAKKEVIYKSGDYQELSLHIKKANIGYYIVGIIALLIFSGVLIWLWKSRKKKPKRKKK